MPDGIISTPERATLTLAERIKVILTDLNKKWTEGDIRDQLENPEDDFKPTPSATVAGVVKSLSASGIQNAYGLDNGYRDDAMTLIMDEIMREIAGDDYDPWPELTKEELRFLVGDRKNSTQCPYPLYIAVGASEPLTFAERVNADRNRTWLERGIEVKRKRLAKAQAEVAKLSGKAA